MVRQLKLIFSVSLFAVALIFTGRFANAQDAPTPPPWSQATIDAAIDTLTTQTAATPSVTETAPTFLTENGPGINATNLDRIEPMAHYDIDAEFLFFQQLVISPDNRWTAVNAFDQRTDGSVAFTIWLIDRWALDQPAKPVSINGEGQIRGFPVYQVVDEVLYYQDDQLALLRYDVNTGEPLTSLEETADIESFEASSTQNVIFGFMGNDEILVWDKTSGEVIQRIDAPRGLNYGFILDDERVLTFHRNRTANVIDLETGDVLETWTGINVSIPFALDDRTVFYLQTIEGEVLKIDSDTLRTVDRLNIGPTSGMMFVGPSGRFILTWDEREMLNLWSFLPSLRETHFPELDGLMYEINRQEDLFLLNIEEGYELYALSEDGLEPLALPEALEDSNGQDESLFFVQGDQLIHVAYLNDFTQVRLTLWGVVE